MRLTRHLWPHANGAHDMPGPLGPHATPGMRGTNRARGATSATDTTSNSSNSSSSSSSTSIAPAVHGSATPPTESPPRHQPLPRPTPLHRPLHSAHWFRLAPMRPQLPAPVCHERQVLRGQVWHTLTSADGQRNFRLNAAAWSAVARCDGQHTVQQLWQAAQALHADAAPTQDELLQMLSQLHAAGLLSLDRRPDFGDSGASAGEPCAHGGAARASPWGASTPSPPQGEAGRRQHLLAWRVSLGNPNALLQRLAQGCGQVGAGLHRLHPIAARALALLFTGGTALAALLHAAELARAVGPLLANPASWGLAVLAYPLMKLLHELAHGVVARRCGAVVSDWGVTWLMFLPVPYVDASAASALPQRRQRLAVSAAGIAAELLVAAAACALALLVQPGALRDAALLVMCMALGSSLLVNANPLLRFDGYHMLCDTLGLPNLAARSGRHWLLQLRQHGLGQRPQAPVAAAPGEAAWLWAYAPAALAMRGVVAVAVVLWLGGVSQLLGQLALVLMAWTLLLQPARRLLSGLQVPQRPGWRARLPPGAAPQIGPTAAPSPALAIAHHAAAAAWLLPAAGLAAALLWPLPVASVAQGVLWLPESALVRAQARGFVAQVLVHDGQRVQAGDPVLTLHAPALQAQADRLRGHVQDLQAEELQALRTDAAAAAATQHALQAAQAEWALAQQRLARLTVRAQASGRIVINQAADLPGRHVERGALLAHVMTGEPGLVKLAVAQQDAARLPTQPTTVQVLAADDPGAAHTGRWLGAATGAHTQLPSAALGSRSGGRVGIDGSDPAGLRPSQPVVLGDVQLHGAAATRIGQRVLVRFEHGHAPLLLQAARAGQQLLLRHFNPSR